MVAGRIRKFLSRLVSPGQWRGFRRRSSSEQDRGRIQQCSDHDSTHSSEMLGCSQVSSHKIILTQDFTQIQPGETPVASPLGPCEEVGDGRPSLLVHGDGNSNYLKTSHSEVLGIKPPCVQNLGGPIVSSPAVQENCSEDKDGYLGDRHSSKDSVQNLDAPIVNSSAVQESCSEDEDGYLGDGDSSDLNDLEERMPPVGEDQPPSPFPLKKETSLPLKQRDDNLHHPQIPEQFPGMKNRLSPEGQLSHNLQDYSNLSSLQHHLESGKSLHRDKTLLPKHCNFHELAVDSSSITSPPNFSPCEKSKRPSRKRRHRLACSPPENRSERQSHEQRRQLPRSESGKLRSTKWGKKRRLQRKKKKKRRARKAINLGNSSGKGKTPSFTSKPHEQSDVQSHTTKGCGEACISHVTRRNKPSQPRDSSSSSSDNRKSSESENESSGSSSDSKNRQSKRKRARKTKQQSPGNNGEEKEKSSDSESSGEFETAPEDEEGTANKNKGSQDPKDVFVAGSDKEQHLESGNKSPDRRSLDSFTSENTISKQPTSQTQDRPKAPTPAQLDNSHPTQRLQLSGVIAEELGETQQASTESTANQVPSTEATPQVVFHQPNLTLIRPEVGASPQPDSAAENKQKSFKDDAIGGSSKTKSASQASQSKPLCVGGSDLLPVCKPFPWQAEEKPTTQPQLIPSRTLTPRARELRAQLACSAIMPIHVQCGRPPCTQDFSVEEVLELCAVGDLSLLLNAVKVLGTILYCKQSFTQCGQPLASIIPGVWVDCQDEHEWVLVIDIDVTACDTETFGSFVMDIFRLISNLLEKWQAFHSPEKHQPQLISLLKYFCNTIKETCLSDFDDTGADRLLKYLVKLLAPFCEH